MGAPSDTVSATTKTTTTTSLLEVELHRLVKQHGATAVQECLQQILTSCQSSSLSFSCKPNEQQQQQEQEQQQQQQQQEQAFSALLLAAGIMQASMDGILVVAAGNDDDDDDDEGNDDDNDDNDDGTLQLVNDAAKTMFGLSDVTDLSQIKLKDLLTYPTHSNNNSNDNNTRYRRHRRRRLLQTSQAPRLFYGRRYNHSNNTNNKSSSNNNNNNNNNASDTQKPSSSSSSSSLLLLKVQMDWVETQQAWIVICHDSSREFKYAHKLSSKRRHESEYQQYVNQVMISNLLTMVEKQEQPQDMTMATAMATATAVLVTNSMGIIQRVNDAFLQQFHYHSQPQQIVGRHLLQLLILTTNTDYNHNTNEINNTCNDKNQNKNVIQQYIQQQQQQQKGEQEQSMATNTLWTILTSSFQQQPLAITASLLGGTDNDNNNDCQTFFCRIHLQKVLGVASKTTRRKKMMKSGQREKQEEQQQRFVVVVVGGGGGEQYDDDSSCGWWVVLIQDLSSKMSSSSLSSPSFSMTKAPVSKTTTMTAAPFVSKPTAAAPLIQENVLVVDGNGPPLLPPTPRQRNSNSTTNATLMATMVPRMPRHVWEQLQHDPKHIASFYPHATILFAGICGFTETMSQSLTPIQAVNLLSSIFQRFDELLDQHNNNNNDNNTPQLLYKVKTVGDCYMVAALSTPSKTTIPNKCSFYSANNVAATWSGDNDKDDDDGDGDDFDMFDDGSRECVAMCRLAVEMLHALPETVLDLRIGIHTGPVVAGVVVDNSNSCSSHHDGNVAPIPVPISFDMWGDGCNLANHMESYGVPGRIQVSHAVVDCLQVAGKLVKKSNTNTATSAATVSSSVQSVAATTTARHYHHARVSDDYGSKQDEVYAWVHGVGSGHDGKNDFGEKEFVVRKRTDMIDIKGDGIVDTYFLTRIQPHTNDDDYEDEDDSMTIDHFTLAAQSHADTVSVLTFHSHDSFGLVGGLLGQY